MAASDRINAYIDCHAIAAGTILALAITIVFTQFGAALGLSITPDIEWTQEAAAGKLITIGLWFLWVQILSTIIGAYVAGRMRFAVEGKRYEREMRDGVHGLLVWASATVAVTVGVALITAWSATVEPAAAERTEDILELQRSASIIAAFSTAAASLVAAVAAWWAGDLGGDHRDEETDHSRYVSFRRNKKK